LYRQSTNQPLSISGVFGRIGDGVGPPDRGNRRSRLGGHGMSYMKGSGAVAAMVTALALSASAYGDGKSPNGPPGPEGNPNQPAAAQPQAKAPQGPAGERQGKEHGT